MGKVQTSSAARSGHSTCTACGGSGISGLTCDNFVGAGFTPCARCGGRKPGIMEDRMFLVQLAASLTIAAVTMAGVLIFA